LRRNEEPGYWVNEWVRWTQEAKPARVVVPDVRFGDESAILKHSGGVIFRVIRPGHDTGAAGHASEDLADRDDGWDHVFLNDRTVADLHGQVDLWAAKHLPAGPETL
jgi:hypothetical protein